MGATYPDLDAAIGVHSGLACGAAHDMPSALAAMRQGGTGDAHRPGTAAAGEPAVPTIVFHGDQDGTVHPHNGDLVIAQARAAAAQGLRVEEERGRTPSGYAYSRTLHADPSGKPIFEQWVIHGAGHAWFGGSPAGSYTDPRGPDASREMMRFFLIRPVRDRGVSRAGVMEATPADASAGAAPSPEISGGAFAAAKRLRTRT